MRTKQANASRMRDLAESRGDTELVAVIDEAFFDGMVGDAGAMSERYEDALHLAARISAGVTVRGGVAQGLQPSSETPSF